MPRRRTVLGAAGGIVGTTLLGLGAAARTRSDEPTEAVGAETAAVEFESVESAVAYVRTVEEVRGHLVSSATLLEQGRREDAAVHAGHPPDYFAAILTPLRDADPELATRTRAALKRPARRVQSMSASGYREYLTDQVFPLLDRAVERVVAGDLRASASFDARVMNALAGRIVDEYGAAVTSNGSIDRVGEYWDGRGFLVRIEKRYARAASALGGAGSEALSRLRTEMVDIAAPEAVRATSLRFRTATTAAAGLPGAVVEGRDDALTYVRNVEEVRGHLAASLALSQAGDDDRALHAGHALDYAMALVPPVRAADTALARRLLDRMAAVDERVASMEPSEYEQFVTGELSPLLDRAVSTAVPDEYAGSSSFGAAVFLSLGDRIVDEYTAAVTEDEVIERYGEYWDGRGFLVRMEERVAGFESALDGQTRSDVAEELDVLRTEMETARPPADVAGSVDALHELLDEFAGA
ncbi:MAG: hypothetical protein ABEJ43_06565 [Haloferacaceae archaeon]